MLIVDKFSFRFVEELHFKRLVNIVCPLFQIHSKRRITQQNLLVVCGREKLKFFIKAHNQRNSLTNDI